jgi:hypothetical protein
VEVLIPFSSEFSLVLGDQFLDPVQFDATKVPAAGKSNRIEPELGPAVVANDVDVPGFRFIGGVELESVRSDDLDGGHEKGVPVRNAFHENDLSEKNLMRNSGNQEAGLELGISVPDFLSST